MLLFKPLKLQKLLFETTVPHDFPHPLPISCTALSATSKCCSPTTMNSVVLPSKPILLLFKLNTTTKLSDTITLQTTSTTYTLKLGECVWMFLVISYTSVLAAVLNRPADSRSYGQRCYCVFLCQHKGQS
ncbi:hypothetical protein VNO80_28300 [Phaseolus coccineus]|uniref:Uncharacterized protein n=1 Tax=Phaseolus coccineus TaxID=3886 RepID=A0AAN9QDV9_PHACN